MLFNLLLVFSLSICLHILSFLLSLLFSCRFWSFSFKTIILYILLSTGNIVIQCNFALLIDLNFDSYWIKDRWLEIINSFGIGLHLIDNYCSAKIRNKFHVKSAILGFIKNVFNSREKTVCFYHVTYAFRVNLLSEVVWMSKNSCSKMPQYLNFKWLQQDSNPQTLSS